MNEPFKFLNSSYFADSRRLKIEDGSVVRLRPKVASLLLAFLLKPQVVLSKAFLIHSVWGANSIATDHDLHNLKGELVRAFGGDEEIIEEVTGKGYKFTPSVESPGPTRQSSELTVEPRIIGSGKKLGISSWLGHGKSDNTEAVKWAIPFRKEPRRAVPINSKRPLTLKISFRHEIGASPEESWWSAVIPIRNTSREIKWRLVDLHPFQQFSFEARFTAIATESPSLSLGVRFEDGSARSRNQSLHNSTSWYPESVLIGNEFQEFKLELDNFDWTDDGWPGNLEPVNRGSMLQIVFGQDDEFAPAQGTLEIRNINFSTLS